MFYSTDDPMASHGTVQDIGMKGRGRQRSPTLHRHFDFLVVPFERWLSALPAAVFDALPVEPLRSTLLAAFAARGLVRLPVTRITSLHECHFGLLRFQA